MYICHTCVYVLYIMYMHGLPAWVIVYYICTSCSQRSEEVTRSHGPGVIDGWEQTCGCWKLYLGPLEEQLVLLPLNQLSSPSVVFIPWSSGRRVLLLVPGLEKM